MVRKDLLSIAIVDDMITMRLKGPVCTMDEVQTFMCQVDTVLCKCSDNVKYMVLMDTSDVHMDPNSLHTNNIPFIRQCFIDRIQTISVKVRAVAIVMRKNALFDIVHSCIKAINRTYIQGNHKVELLLTNRYDDAEVLFRSVKECALSQYGTRVISNHRRSRSITPRTRHPCDPTAKHSMSQEVCLRKASKSICLRKAIL